MQSAHPVPPALPDAPRLAPRSRHAWTAHGSEKRTARRLAAVAPVRARACRTARAARATVFKPVDPMVQGGTTKTIALRDVRLPRVLAEPAEATSTRVRVNVEAIPART